MYSFVPTWNRSTRGQLNTCRYLFEFSFVFATPTRSMTIGSGSIVTNLTANVTLELGRVVLSSVSYLKQRQSQPFCPRRLFRHLGIAVALIMAAPVSPARADNVVQLSTNLLHGQSEKTRIAAAVSLGRLRDSRSLRPLVRALADDSAVVRALAATALGHLGNADALPALRRASKDRDRSVRRNATQAIARIRFGKNPPRKPRRAVASRSDNMASYSMAPRERPRPGRPEVYVVLQSMQDKSPGRRSKRLRERHTADMRAMLMAELKSDQHVTLLSAVAEQGALEPYSVDLSIVKLERIDKKPLTEIECQIRIAVSNQRGKMISVLTGGAKVQVPSRTFHRRHLPALEREALHNAVKSVHQDLIAYLRNRPS